MKTKLSEIKNAQPQESIWYNSLIEDCKAIITEAVFTSRWTLVEGYWNLGDRIFKENNNFERAKIYGDKIVQGLAQSLHISRRTIWCAIQFRKKYPSLDNVPEGKNISWSKLITKYLPAPKENKLTLPLPIGKFEIIVIDPPWPYGTEYDAETRRVASPYPELSITEIKNLQLPSADDCILWLWTTHRFIWDAKQLLEYWGFDYKAILVWDKEKMGMGEWLRMQCEFCLLGIKGKPTWNIKNIRDIIREPRTKHSKKPESFYKMIEDNFEGRKLDIFAREKRNGWETYGNEIL